MATVEDCTRELFDFVVERHMVHRRKKAGKPKPWTDDPVLQEYRFCNVYRELDTVTKWIAENWRKPHEDGMDVWFAMVVARFVNWPDTLAEIGYPVPWNPDRFIEAVDGRMRREEKAWTGAYMIRAQPGYPGTKAEYLAKEVFAPLWEDRRKLRIVQHGTLAEAYVRLMPYRDMGSFMVGQVIADLKYTPRLRKAEDWWTWATPGPGSKRGLNRVVGRDVKSKWTDSDWFACLTELRREISPMMKEAGLRKLHAQDLQNCLCEFDKLERVRHGEGKPRSKYPGTV